LPVACFLLPVACCLLPVACCLLPVACCLMQFGEAELQLPGICPKMVTSVIRYIISYIAVKIQAKSHNLNFFTKKGKFVDYFYLRFCIVPYKNRCFRLFFVIEQKHLKNADKIGYNYGMS
jgi:hypothetical protein